MTTPLLDVTVDFSGRGDLLNVCLLGYELELATSFGTSHSTSSFRNNALLLLRVPSQSAMEGETAGKVTWDLRGVGEVGLPPKKTLVYEADLNDISAFMNSFLDELQAPKGSSSSLTTNADVFASLPERYFSRVRRGNEGEVLLPYHRMLQALDMCACSGAIFGRAGRALVESALFDAWAKELQLPLHELINVSPISSTHRSFYTAALNDDISLIVQAAIFGAKHTPQLKIKLNDSVELAKRILHELDVALPYKEGHWWSVDANSAWSPDVAEEMLREVLEPYKHRLFMVEQPFVVDVHLNRDNATCDRWIEVKGKYNACDILLFADESMRTAEDVSLLAPFVNGVNIKLEKCGGFRAALLAVQEAQKHELMVWFGCMVGSNINSTSTAHIFSLACCSDLDGALLVTQDSQLFFGGFEYVLPQGNILLPSTVDKSCYGIGVVPKSSFSNVISNCMEL